MADLLTLNGLTIAFERPGVALRPPILFVHGLLAGAWYFEQYMRFFAAQGHPCYALNLRGHHGSRPVPDIGRVSIAEYVDDALEVAHAIAEQRGFTPAYRRGDGVADGGAAVVVGHSMGGLIAQKLAEAGATRAVVLLCSAAPRGILMTGPGLLRKQLKYLPALLLSRPIAGTLRDNIELNFNLIPAEEHEGIHARFVPDSGRAGRQISLGTIAVDTKRVSCAVLVIGATQDRFVPVRVARKLAAKYQADYLEYPEHAHLILCEPGWERPAADIARWLERV